jgi:Ser/Thr protein kinase RdoA (MazF antagonist)
MSVPPGFETVSAAAETFVPGGVIEPVGGRSWLVSATTGGERFSVRQLDPGLPGARVELVHELLSLPELQHATRLIAAEGTGAHAFDVRAWMTGDVLGNAIPGPNWRTLHLPGELQTDQLGRIATSLGEFHHDVSSASLLARAPRFRAREWLNGVRRGLELDARLLSGELRKESRARRWLTASRPLLASAETSLEQVGYLRDEQLVIAHLNLWGSHLVRQADRVSFLDFATIAAAPAIVDIAQLIARNGPWSDDRVELVLNCYAEANALSPLQRRVLPWLAALDAVASCGRLLVRATTERDPLPERDQRAIFNAIDPQLGLLQSLASAFVPPPPRPYRRPGPRRNRPAA